MLKKRGVTARAESQQASIKDSQRCSIFVFGIILTTSDALPLLQVYDCILHIHYNIAQYVTVTLRMYHEIQGKTG
jgi:hypothetical protein